MGRLDAQCVEPVFLPPASRWDIHEQEVPGYDKARRCDALFLRYDYVGDSRSIRKIVRLLKVSRNAVRLSKRVDSAVGLRAQRAAATPALYLSRLTW